MATGNEFGVPHEGPVGPYTYYMRKGKIVIRKRTNNVSKGLPTENRMKQQMQFANDALIWRQFGKELHPSFEIKNPGETDYNAFMRENAQVAHVYLTKEMVESGACVLFPAILGHGNLPHNVQITETEEYYVSDILTGDIQVDQNTLVNDFAYSVLNAEEDRFEPGDYIGFFKGTQFLDINTQQPTVTIEGARVKLDVDCKLKLYDVVRPTGFQVVDGKLAAEKSPNSYYAWIHLRETRQKEFLTTTQRFVGENTFLPRYTTPKAFEDAAETYGGYKNKYLTPPQNTDRKNRYQRPSDSGTSGDGGNNGNPDPTPTQVTLTCTVVGSGGTVTPTETTVDTGTSVTFTAHPNSGKRVKRWSTGATGNTLTVTATTNQAYTVEFETDPNYNSGGDL